MTNQTLNKKEWVMGIVLGIILPLAVYGVIKISDAGNSSAGNGNPSGGAPKIMVEPMEFNAGDVSMAKGNYTTAFKIRNEGAGDLKISKIITSCMCTTARLKVDGRTSPAFGMPGHSSGAPFWQETVKAGGEGELELIFDPLAHGPEAIGPIERFIRITSNDSQNKDLDIKFSANVVK